MTKLISFKLAANGTLALTVLSLLYHSLIISGTIPFEAVWGGRLRSYDQMLRFESFSIALNLFILLFVLVAAGYLAVKIPNVVQKVLLWLFVALFSLNTLGNLMSANFWEMLIFTPLTAVLAIFFWRMAREKREPRFQSSGPGQ